MVFELIDMRSFSNLWYWIVLAVVWSSASHWVLGVPYDMVIRARRHGGDAEADLRDMVRINVNRLQFMVRRSGLWMLGLSCFFLTSLGIIGFVYAVEFAQAVFLIALPLNGVLALSIRTARRIRAADGVGMYNMLVRHRVATQIVGMVSIFVTAFWGMLQNMALGAF
ncbi:MAG: component of SufBCD complex [Tropicimonas sp.]